MSSKQKKRIAVYAGSFDPPTLGHCSVIDRAATLFDELHIVIGISADKTGWLTTDERLDLLHSLYKKHSHIVVASHRGLTADYALKIHADALVRGLRSGADYDYEVAMAQMNRHLAAKIQTIFLPTDPALFHISSSLVRDIIKHQGSLEGLVPPAVKTYLDKRRPKAGQK